MTKQEIQTLTSTVQRTGNRSATMMGMIAGLGVTILFYLIAPIAGRLFNGGEVFVQRYFCGHPLEYITSAIFFIGMGILAAKLAGLPRERRALRSIQNFARSRNWLARNGSADSVIADIREWDHSNDSRQSAGSLIHQRLHDIVHYVTARPDAAPEDHLKYLADLAADRLVQSYSLVRTVTWAVPIMGFLGTVVGITMAIANVTPEQLDSSLPEVTSGLAVAFDTTAQALGMSMILVFGTFLVERSEQSVLNETEQFGIDCLLPCLRTSSSSSQESSAIADWTLQLLAKQSEFWNHQFAALQTNWQQTLAHQTSQLAQALNDETQSTLAHHRDSLGSARDLYAATLQQSSQALHQQLQSAMTGFVSRIDSWQQAMQESSLASAGQSEELHRLGRTLLQLTESEERLARLQDQLNQNLQTVQIVQTLEQTVSSLNAAVAVLTAKTSFRVAG